MGSLGDVTKVQAQYNWVDKPNCTEVLHLLQQGTIVDILDQFPLIFWTFLVFVRLLDSYCLNPRISNFDSISFIFHDLGVSLCIKEGLHLGFG